MEPIGTQPLTTPRLTLRRYTEDDVDAMFDNWASDPRVTATLTWPTHPDRDVTRAVLAMWVEAYEQPSVYHWGIELDGVLIGDIAVVDADWREMHRHCEVGYCIGYDHWGKGYMTEALGAVLGFLFERVGAHRVYLRHAANNPASGRVMQKCGLRHEGALREHRQEADGSWTDLALYGILRREWIAARAQE